MWRDFITGSDKQQLMPLSLSGKIMRVSGASQKTIYPAAT
jgi:hypothetical protein